MHAVLAWIAITAVEIHVGYYSRMGDAYRVSGVQPYSCTVAHGSSVQLYMMSVDIDLTGCLELSIVV